MPTSHSAYYLDALADGRLVLQRCAACGGIPGFPRIACPDCFEPLEWFEAQGAGTIRTYSVLRRTHAERYESQLPIVLVRVELDEGAEMIATLVGENRLLATVGARIAFADSGGWSTLPQFRLAQTEQATNDDKGRP